MELKKSYKGFIIWLMLFFMTLLSLSFLPIENPAIITRILLIVTMSFLTLLMFIIYKTEYIYWINGVEYEVALKAGSHRRKQFAFKHFKRFIMVNLIFLIYSFIAYLLNVPFWLDIIVCGIGIIITAFSTINIEL